MKVYLSAAEAAEHLGISDMALRSARSKGVLSGVKPPAFIKRGQRVFYKRVTLDAWLAQFEEQEN